MNKEEVLKELEIMYEALKNLSGSRGLMEDGVSIRYGKGVSGWGMRGLSSFKQDMRNSLKRIEKCLDFNGTYKTRN